MTQQNGNIALSQTVLDAIRKAGGIERVPEALLTELSLGRVFDELAQSWELVDRDNLIALQLKARELFAARQGDLQAADLDLVEAVLKTPCKRKATIEDFTAIESRAMAFEAAGIPPVFEPSFYPMKQKLVKTGGWKPQPVMVNRRFPVIEMALEFGSGAYFEYIREYGARKGAAFARAKGGKVWNYPEFQVPPASVEDAMAFRQTAFLDERTIDPALIREQELYTSERFAFKSEVDEALAQSRDELVYRFLAEQMSGMPWARLPAVGYGSDLASFLKKWRWYAKCNPATRQEVIRQFRAGLPAKPLAADRKILERLAELFPGCLDGLGDELVAKARGELRAKAMVGVIEAEVKNDFRKIPQPAFLDAVLWKEVGPRAVAAFRAACQKLGEEYAAALFSNSADLNRHIPMPNGMATLVEFKEELDAVRLGIATKLEDEEFLDIFGGESGSPNWARRITIGHSKWLTEARSSTALRQYVNRRWKELSGNSEE